MAHRVIGYAADFRESLARVAKHSCPFQYCGMKPTDWRAARLGQRIKFRARHFLPFLSTVQFFGYSLCYDNAWANITSTSAKISRPRLKIFVDKSVTSVIICICHDNRITAEAALGGAWLLCCLFSTH